jgi:hypothetical protein
LSRRRPPRAADFTAITKIASHAFKTETSFRAVLKEHDVALRAAIPPPIEPSVVGGPITVSVEICLPVRGHGWGRFLRTGFEDLFRALSDFW